MLYDVVYPIFHVTLHLQEYSDESISYNVRLAGKQYLRHYLRQHLKHPGWLVYHL